jgi:Tol biopolymer transport system component
MRWVRVAGTIAVLAAALVACDMAPTRDGVAVSARGSLAPTPIASTTLDRAEPPEPRPRVEPGDYFVDLETGEATSLPEPITRLTRGGGGGYRVSPDGSQLLFEVVERGSPRSQLFIANIDGSDARQLTDTPNGAALGDFAPDGMRIVFVSGSRIHLNEKILVLDLETEVSRRFVRVGTPSAMPRFDPEGDEILFTATRRSRVGLWTAPTSGGEEPFELRRHAMWGTYSPDGERLVFLYPLPAGIDSRDPRWVAHDVMLADADGSGARTLASDLVLDLRHPIWSPDGTRIAVSTDTRVYLIEVSTGEITPVAAGFAADWLDDRTLIVERYRGLVGREVSG